MPMWKPWKQTQAPQQQQQPAQQPQHEPRERFGDLGEFGVSSDELPTVRPDAAMWRERWAAEQRALVRSRRMVEWLLANGRISGPAYDLFQVEFSAGLVPWAEVDRTSGWPRRVWSAQLQQWFSPSGWERRAQELLPVGDPERVTLQMPSRPSFGPQAAYDPPPITPAPPSQWLARPWAPALDTDPRFAPAPQMRTPLPVGMGQPAAPTRPIVQENNEQRGLY